MSTVQIRLSPRLVLLFASIGCLAPCTCLAESDAHATSPHPSAPLAPGDLAFERVAATDLAGLKTLLEKAGWPASHVRALLNVEVIRRINPDPVLRLEDLKPFHFWHTGPDALPVANLTTPAELQQRAAREELVRAKYEELFPHQETDTDLLDRWEEQRRWGELPPEKRGRVLALLEESTKARDAFLESRGRLLTRDEWETLWSANRDARSRLEELLPPGERLDYDLRNSNTAAQMRIELDAFAPTREEFIALFRTRHPLELEFEDKPPGLDPAIDARREQAENAALEKIRALLGPARFDDYRLSACQTLRFDGRYARTDAASCLRLYRSLLKTKAALENLNTQKETGRDEISASLKAALYREFRAVLDEEGTRRYLQEQSLWP